MQSRNMEHLTAYNFRELAGQRTIWHGRTKRREGL